MSKQDIVRSLSHLPPILENGTSSTRFQEHSTTAAPNSSNSGLSAGERIVFALGLQESGQVEVTLSMLGGTNETTTPACF